MHEAKHVANLIYLYYPKIKPGGFILVDDISCLPYLEGKKKNSFGNEIANQETFDIIQEIFATNTENFDLEFSFIDSGLAKELTDNPFDPNAGVQPIDFAPQGPNQEPAIIGQNDVYDSVGELSESFFIS